MSTYRTIVIVPLIVFVLASIASFYFLVSSTKHYQIALSLKSTKSGNLEILYQYDLNDPVLQYSPLEIEASDDFREYLVDYPGSAIHALRIDPHIESATISISSIVLKSSDDQVEVFPRYSVEPNDEVNTSRSSQTLTVWEVGESLYDPIVWFLMDEPAVIPDQGWLGLLIKAFIIASLLSAMVAISILIYSRSKMIQSAISNWNHQTKGSTFLPLLALCSIAFIWLPYIYIDLYPVFIVTSITGFIAWAYIARFPFGQFDLRVALFKASNLWILVIALLLSFQALQSSIAFMGDEDYHISSIQYFKQLLGYQPWVIGVPLVIILTTTAIFRYFGALAASCVLLISSALLGWSASGIESFETYLIRYPSLSKWLMVTPVYVSETILSNQAVEWVYRLIPFFAYTAILLYLFFKLQFLSKISQVLLLLALATIPNLWFYSSILYPELLLIFLMCLMVFNLEVIQTEDFQQIKESPFWVAAICAGFIKETYLPVIAALIALRALFLIIHYRNPLKLINRGFFAYSFGIIFPLAYYVFIRKYIADDPRGYAPYWENLLNWELYGRFALNLWQQYGFLLILSFVGATIMLWQRHYKSLFSQFLLLAAVTLFFFLDDASNFGYSRFNLLLLPTLLYLSFQVLKVVASIKFPAYAPIIVAVIWLSFNATMAPLNGDGSRKPNWSTNHMDLLEQSFPYREALGNFESQYSSSSLALINQHNYGYKIDYYLDSKDQNYMGAYTLRTFKETFNQQNSELPDWVITQFELNGLPADHPLIGYTQSIVFKNEANSLYLYRR